MYIILLVVASFCHLQPRKIPRQTSPLPIACIKTQSPHQCHTVPRLSPLAHRHLLAGGNVGAHRGRRGSHRAPRPRPSHRRLLLPAHADAVPGQRLRGALLPALPPRPLCGALRWRGRGVRSRRRAGLPRPRPLLPRPRGLALRGARAYGAVRPGAGAGARGRGPGRGRGPDGPLRQPAVRGFPGHRAGEARGGAAPAQRDVRHGDLLLRHPAPPDRLAPLPRRVFRRRRRQERHAHRRGEGPRKELPQRILRRLLPLRPVPAKGQGEREPGGRRRRPRPPDAGAGLPADGPDVAPGQEQDGVHPHRVRRAARHALRRAPHRVRQPLQGQRRGAAAAVQPGPGEHAAGRRLAAVRPRRQHELGSRPAPRLPPLAGAVLLRLGRVLVDRAVSITLVDRVFCRSWLVLGSSFLFAQCCRSN